MSLATGSGVSGASKDITAFSHAGNRSVASFRPSADPGIVPRKRGPKARAQSRIPDRRRVRVRDAVRSAPEDAARAGRGVARRRLGPPDAHQAAGRSPGPPGRRTLARAAGRSPGPPALARQGRRSLARAVTPCRVAARSPGPPMLAPDRPARRGRRTLGPPDAGRSPGCRTARHAGRSLGAPDAR